MKRRLIISLLVAAAVLYAAQARAAVFPMGMPAGPYMPALQDARAASGIVAGVPGVRGITDFGRRLPDQTLVVTDVWLAYRHPTVLEQLTALQSRKGAWMYRRYLTNREWNSYFAPTVGDVNRAIASLVQGGFRILSVSPNRNLIRALGPAGAVQHFYHTELHIVYQPGVGYRFANVRPAVVPAELRGTVIAVTGLHSLITQHYQLIRTNRELVRRRPMGTIIRPLATPTPKPISTATPSPAPSPAATLLTCISNGLGGCSTGGDQTQTQGFGYCHGILANAFDFPVQHGYNGHGRSVANIISAQTFNSDLQNVWTECGIPTPPNPIRPFVECAGFAPDNGPAVAGCEVTSRAGADAGEAALDASAITGMAYGAQFYEYLIPDLSTNSISDAWNKVVSDNIVDAANMSVGGCETDDPIFEYVTDYVATQGAAKGITFATSSGDGGSRGCSPTMNGAPGMVIGVEAPASDIHVVGMGGLTIATGPMASNYLLISASAWTFAGGGISGFLSEPSWQSALNSTNSGLSHLGRNVPELSLPADPNAGGLETFVNGLYQGVGGTSEASPLFIGMLVTISQIEGARFGWVNPRLYAVLACDQTNGCDQTTGGYYHYMDITVGDNGDYAAGTGYDDATGIGAPLGWKLGGTL
jgi:subtilase family serine protease